MRTKLTAWQKICQASRLGRGLHLTNEEVNQLTMSTEVCTVAQQDYEDQGFEMDYNTFETRKVKP